MKNFFTLLFLFVISSAHAATYYFSSASGDDSRTSTQAKSASTPWKSLSKLNTFFSSLLPGDSVLLNRGETFYGSIVVNKSGIKGSPIVIGAYGSGNKPVVTALTRLSNWVAIGNGVYESYNFSLGANLNILLLNDIQQPIGRYPNTGYLKLESHSGNTITDNELSSTPNWTGAELVLRANHWKIERYKITSHSGTTIYFTGTYAQNNYGYFIQNSVKALDQLGEWSYNPSTKKVSMYFGTKSPSSYNVTASALDSLVSSKSKSYVVFDNLTLKGANKYNVNINSGTDFQVKNCDILFSGINGVQVSNHTYFKIENCTVLNSNNNGIAGGSNSVIRNNIVKNSYSIPGMGQNGDGQGSGIQVGESSIAEYNQVINSGFNAIMFNGDSCIVKNNYIDTFCFVKDDGAAIYTANSMNLTYKGRKVTGNIVLNGIGAADGTNTTSSSADGIYMDDDANGVEISGNTITNTNRGIYLHNSRDIIVKNNISFDNSSGQLHMKYDGLGSPLRNHTITNNIFFSKLAKQITSSIYTKVDDIASIGRLDSNYYARPIDDRTSISNVTYLYSSSEDKNYFDLAGWKAEYNKDLSSKISAKQIAPYKVKSLTSSTKFAYGAFNSSSDAGKLWANSCTVTWQNSGVLDGGYVKIVPSADNSSIVVRVGGLDSAKKYILRYSLKGTGSMSVNSYLRSSDYKAISSIQYRTVSTTRSENEMMFTSSANQTYAAVVFIVDAQSTYYLDNIHLYEADVAATNPDDSIRLVYNASPLSKTISLNGNYVDVKNNKYSNSIVLQPYQSSVLISNGGIQNNAPTVSITSPATAATFTASASVTISAAAADADGKVSKVEFYNGSTLLGTDTSSPYTYIWNNVPAGNYTITAKATDNGSLVTASAAVAISVSAPNAAPSVSITSPVTNATFAAPASVTISAAAADADGKVSKVQFYNGSTLLATDTSSPYSYTWNNVPAGNYTITAKATDNGSLVTASAAVVISVYTPNGAPSVSITSPVTNATFTAPASVTINAAAADTDGTISKVEFYNSDTLLGTVTASPYTFTWNNVASGNYKITAKATDNSLLAATSAPVAISVYAPNVAPSISITGISTNVTVAAPASVTLSATAADADGTISKVEFYNADTLIGTVAASPYTFTWNNVASGTYTFTAKATDDKGAVTVSSKVTITVVAPIVSLRSISKEEMVSKADLLSVSLKVFPNPASSTIFVSGNGLPQNKDFIISVVSINGTVLKTIHTNTSDKAVEVNISSLSSGVYTIKAAAGSITMNKQFVKL